MKRKLLWIIPTLLLVMAFGFTACREADNQPQQFEKGIVDFAVVQGTNPGELIYSFTATTPAADTYTLYFIQGVVGMASIIINSGTGVSVEPASASSPETISGLDLEVGEIYSIVVVAEKRNFERAVSEIRQVTISGTWDSKLVLTVKQGEPGELTFSFETTALFEAAALGGTIYTLYFAEGNIDDADDIIEAAIAVDNVIENVTVGSQGTISGLANDTEYSVVVVAAREHFENAYSDVVPARTIGVWYSGPTNLTVEPGSPGQLVVSFDAAVPTTPSPAEGTTYRLYIAKGNRDIAWFKYPANSESITTQTTTNLEETIPNLANDTEYSVVVVAIRGNFDDYILDEVATARTIRSPWEGGITNITVVQESLRELLVTFDHTTPEAESYTLHIAPETLTTVQAVIDADSTGRPVEAGVQNSISGLENDAPYSLVIVARKTGFEDWTTGVIQARTSKIIVNVTIEESGLDTLVTWSFVDAQDNPVFPNSPITLTYNYSGLAVTDGRLTNTVLPGGNITRILASNVREYTITGGLIAATDIVVSIFDGEVQSDSQNTSPIELRLYNVAYARVRNYGAIEMFSHGRAHAGTLGGTIQARASTIINFDRNGNPVDLYGSTFSRGEGMLAGGPATQLREWYFDGEYLFGRSNGGATNIVDGTGATGAVIPNATPARWADINSVSSGHTGPWNAFHTAFASDPFNFIPYNVNAAFIGLHGFMYTNPQTINNHVNLEGGRSDAPFGIIQTDTRGALAHNSDGTFQFSILMDGNVTGNHTNIEWSGNVTIANMNHSTITFVFDENFRFVKYHAFERYTVTLLSATTNVAATMFFVYHEDSIDIRNYATFRPHQIRENHVNFVAAGVDPETVIAPEGVSEMVVANSRYAITLDWIEYANETSRVAIPRP